MIKRLKKTNNEQSDNMKKILILANNSGGLYHFRFELIKKLIEQDYEVYFSVPQSIEEEKVRLIINSGAKHIQTYINRRGTNPVEDIKLIKKYQEIVTEVAPDIILTYTIKPNIYGNFVASKFNIPVIMNITGIGTSLATGNLKSIIKKMYKYACNKAQIVFFQNKGNLEFFVQNNIVNERKSKLIPGSGVNIERYRPISKTKMDDLTKFIFIGRIMREKGIEEYLQVAENLTHKYSNIEFQILGPFEEEKYKDIIINNKNEKIKYLGVSNDVRKEIREVDCIINPSYHEGMSNVLLEGAAMGKPLIASNISGCKEIIDDGYNGYLFEVKSVKSLGNRITQFLNLNSDERYIMGNRSRKKVENEFDRKIVIDEYLKAIDNILNKG